MVAETTSVTSVQGDNQYSREILLWYFWPHFLVQGRIIELGKFFCSLILQQLFCVYCLTILVLVTFDGNYAKSVKKINEGKLRLGRRWLHASVSLAERTCKKESLEFGSKYIWMLCDQMANAMSSSQFSSSLLLLLSLVAFPYPQWKTHVIFIINVAPSKTWIFVKIPLCENMQKSLNFSRHIEFETYLLSDWKAAESEKNDNKRRRRRRRKSLYQKLLCAWLRTFWQMLLHFYDRIVTQVNVSKTSPAAPLLFAENYTSFFVWLQTLLLVIEIRNLAIWSSSSSTCKLETFSLHLCSFLSVLFKN